MAYFQKPGCKVGRLKPTRCNFFRHGDVISLLGAEPVFLPLLTGDVIVARKDYADPQLGVNDMATSVLNRPMHGPAILAEPQELEP